MFRLLSLLSLVAVSTTVAACGTDDGTRLRQPSDPNGLPVNALADGGGVAPGVDIIEPGDVVTPPTDVPTGNDVGPRPDVVPPDDVIEPPSDIVTVPDAVVDDTVVGPDIIGPACNRDDDCPDNPPCSSGACVNGFCELGTLNADTDCDDGDPCTTADACSEGRCIGFGRLTCNDNSACTLDSCVPGLGCVFDPINCNDDSACTIDSCNPASGCINTLIACPATSAPCLVSGCDPVIGCNIGPAPEGSTCNDNNACTSSDTCVNGLCIGGTTTCDDGNPCTLDACLPNGQCTFTPVPGCVFDPACQNKRGGDVCDDGNTATVADMCISGRCGGYLSKRISGSTVSNYQGLVIQEVDFGPDGWSSIFWSARINASGQTMLAYSLARITNPDAAFVHATTTTAQSYYNDLSDGFVIRNGSNLVAFGNDGWSATNAFNTNLSNEDLDALLTLFTRRDRLANGNAGPRRMWIGGWLDGEGVVLSCATTPGGVECDDQELDSPGFGPVPTAMAGVPICAQNGSCTGAWMGLATDYVDERVGSDLAFNDTYVNPTGTNALWDGGHIAEDPVATTTWAMAGWGTATAPRLLVVGSDGLLNHMRGNNEWTGPLSVKADQTARTFTGVAVSGDTVLVAATRFSGGNIVYELWTIATDGNPSNGDDWRVHELIRGPEVEAAGLYDVAAQPNGEVMAVGGIRRATISGQVNWLDGLVMWRQAR